MAVAGGGGEGCDGSGRQWWAYAQVMPPLRTVLTGQLGSWAAGTFHASSSGTLPPFRTHSLPLPAQLLLAVAVAAHQGTCKMRDAPRGAQNTWWPLSSSLTRAS
eukprot:COSAG01_NODE_1429_length_10330_cov_4.369759_7_plen_104_part_00